MIKDSDIDNPVFVIGTGRSGVTPLMDLIVYHKEFAWPSTYNNRFPKLLKLSYLSRIVEWPVLNTKLKYMRFMPKCSEAYNLFNSLYHGFRRPYRDLIKDDVTKIVREKIRNTVTEIMRYHGKYRFIEEYAGWSRIDFFREIFPNAKFIHVVRDGRAVVNSLTQVGYWRGWGGQHNWRWGPLNEDYRRILEEHNNSFLILAALQWKLLTNNIEQKGSLLPKGHFLTIKHEDRINDPRKIAEKCIQFCGLDHKDENFQNHLNTVRIIDTNNETFRIRPWKQCFTKIQISRITNVLESDLKYFNYI